MLIHLFSVRLLISSMNYIHAKFYMEFFFLFDTATALHKFTHACRETMPFMCLFLNIIKARLTGSNK